MSLYFNANVKAHNSCLDSFRLGQGLLHTAVAMKSDQSYDTAERVKHVNGAEQLFPGDSIQQSATLRSK